jgi:predicted nucleic acid-binding protein
MSDRLLLDTDVLVDYLRGTAEAVEYVEGCSGTLLLSSITVTELYAGAREGRERTALSTFLTAFELVPVTREIAERGGLWRHWRRRGARVAPDSSMVDAGCRCRNPFGEPGDGGEEVVLDVRELPLSGQIGRTLAEMETLPAGRRLRHVNTVVPWPLFAQLEIRGYRYRLVGRKAGNVHVLIWPLAREAARADEVTD